MAILVKIIFLKILSNLTAHQSTPNYQIDNFFSFLCLIGQIEQFKIKNIWKKYFGDFSDPHENGKIPNFHVFSHFWANFSPIFGGVMIHVIAQKKGTILYYKTSLADWIISTSIFLFSCFSETIFCKKKSKVLLQLFEQ